MLPVPHNRSHIAGKNTSLIIFSPFYEDFAELGTISLEGSTAERVPCELRRELFRPETRQEHCRPYSNFCAVLKKKNCLF